jgi:predicted transcriptional regulator
VALVVHGVHDQVQANELYETIRELGQEQSHEDVRLVVISSPTLLRQTMVGAEDVMQRICTLYASESCVLYSAKAPTPPAFYKVCTYMGDIFLLMYF